MKREAQNCPKLIEKAKNDPLLTKQLGEFTRLPMKDQAAGVVRLGRMHGLYFSENDWAAFCEGKSGSSKKVA